MSATDPVSPSGDSIIGSLMKGEKDPTVATFQQGRQSILNSITSIFPKINPVFLIAIVVIVILVLVAIIKI
jgi:hypothetical protein